MDPLNNRRPVDRNRPPQQNTDTSGFFARTIERVGKFFNDLNAAMSDYSEIRDGYKPPLLYRNISHIENKDFTSFLNGLEAKDVSQSLDHLTGVMNSNDPAAKKAAEKILKEMLCSDDNEVLEFATKIVCQLFKWRGGSDVVFPLKALQKMCLNCLLYGLDQGSYSRDSITEINKAFLSPRLTSKVSEPVKAHLLELVKKNKNALKCFLLSMDMGLADYWGNEDRQLEWVGLLSEMLEKECIDVTDFHGMTLESFFLRPIEAVDFLTNVCLDTITLDYSIEVKTSYVDLMGKLSADIGLKEKMLGVSVKEYVNNDRLNGGRRNNALFFCLKVAINELSENTDKPLKEIFLDIANKSQNDSEKEKINNFLQEIDDVMSAIDGDVNAQKKVLKHLNDCANSRNNRTNDRALLTLAAIIGGGHKVDSHFMGAALALIEEKFPKIYNSSVIQGYIAEFSKSTAGAKSVRSAKR